MYTRILLKSGMQHHLTWNPPPKPPLTNFFNQKIFNEDWNSSANNQLYFLTQKFAHQNSSKDLVPKDCLMKLVKSATFSTTPQWRPFQHSQSHDNLRHHWGIKKTLRSFYNHCGKNLFYVISHLKFGHNQFTFHLPTSSLCLVCHIWYFHDIPNEETSDFSWQKPFRSPDDAPPWSPFLAHVEFLGRWGVASSPIMNFRQLGKKQ